MKLGRPPKPARERRERDVRVPVNAAEGRALDAWSEREGKPLAELVRECAMRAAARSA